MKENELITARLSAYDNSYGYSCSLYDNLPYVRDYDRCNETMVRMYSGNVIKINTYNLTDEVTLNNRDIEFGRKLHQMHVEASVVAEGEVIENSDAIEDDDGFVQGLMAEYTEFETDVVNEVVSGDSEREDGFDEH